MEPSPGLDYIQHNVEIGHNYAGLFDINCNILIWIEQLLDGQANAGLSQKNATNISRGRTYQSSAIRRYHLTTSLSQFYSEFF